MQTLKMVEEIAWEICENEGLLIEINANDVIEYIKEERDLTNKEIKEIEEINFEQVYLTCELRNEFENGGRLDNC